MRADRLALLIAALLGMAGCDRITGADQQKIFDAEATGYACRISLKTPEDCMKENETMSPTSILSGWKAANKDVDAQLIDPSMGKNPPESQTPPPIVAAPQAAATAGNPAEKTTATKPAAVATPKAAEQ